MTPPPPVRASKSIMIVISLLVFVLMSLLSWGILHRKGVDFYMLLPFSVFFQIVAVLPFFSWGRAFRRVLYLDDKGVRLHLAEGLERNYPWSEVQAVTISVHTVVYTNDGGRVFFFWSDCGDNLKDYLEFNPKIIRHNTGDLRNPKKNPWIVLAAVAIVVLLMAESGTQASPLVRYTLMGAFGLYVLVKFSRWAYFYICRA